MVMHINGSSLLHKNQRPLADIELEISAQMAASHEIISMAKAANRDLTAAETARCDSLHSQLDYLMAERDMVKRRSGESNFDPSFFAGLNPGDPDFNEEVARRRSGNGGGPGASWQVDSRGTRYAILSREDKATSLLPSKSRHEFGHFVLAKLFGPNAATPPNVRAALSGDVNHLGGTFVPEELSAGIIDLVRARNVMSQAGMQTLLMNSDSLVVPKLASDVVIALRGENDPIAESDPNFSSVRLVAKSAACMTRVSRELVEDSPAMLAEMIGNLLVSAMVSTIDKWALNGTGGVQPEGLFLQSGIGSTGTIGQIDWTDVNAAAVAIRKLNHEPTAMILSPERYADLFNIETGDGTNAARGWLSISPSLKDVLFLQTTHCPDTKAMLGDFTKFAMALRSSPLVEATQVGGDAFERHQVLIKITSRIDFVALDSSAFHSLEGLT
jgi:HK97 family phage major capsid protein